MSVFQGLSRYVKAALLHRLAALVSILLIASIILSLVTSTYFDSGNFKTILLGAAVDLVLVAGQTLVIIGGGFDLSIGSILGLSAVTVGELVQAGVPWGLAAAVALLIGVGCGAVNGLLVAQAGINPLIATLGTLFVFQGIALVWTQSATVFAGASPLVTSIGQGDILGVGTPVWIAAVVVVLAAAGLRWSRFGREIFFIGDNADAARLVGVHVLRVRFLSYVIMGLLAGVAGILAIGRVGTANADTGANEELNVIAAAVLGGASLAGGQGSIVGSVLGVLLIGIVDDAVVLLNVSVFWQQLVVGLVLVGALATSLSSDRVRREIGIRAALAGISASRSGTDASAERTSTNEQPDVPITR